MKEAANVTIRKRSEWSDGVFDAVLRIEFNLLERQLARLCIQISDTAN